MNRRTLLKYLLSTPLALTLDLEKLLWVPNKSIITVPDLGPIIEQFEYYFRTSFYLHIDNPRHVGFIDNIGYEPFIINDNDPDFKLLNGE